jgi:hypothetical protein
VAVDADERTAAGQPRDRGSIYAVADEAAFLETDDHEKREPTPVPPPEGVTFFPCSFCRNAPRQVVISDYPVRDHDTLASVGHASICYDCAVRAAESLTRRPVSDIPGP